MNIEKIILDTPKIDIIKELPESKPKNENEVNILLDDSIEFPIIDNNDNNIECSNTGVLCHPKNPNPNFDDKSLKEPHSNHDYWIELNWKENEYDNPKDFERRSAIRDTFKRAWDAYDSHWYSNIYYYYII